MMPIRICMQGYENIIYFSINHIKRRIIEKLEKNERHSFAFHNIHR